MAGTSKRVFKVNTGFNYGHDGVHRHEPGEVVTDLPTEFVGWMLEEGTIEPYDGPVKVGGFVDEEEAVDGTDVPSR